MTVVNFSQPPNLVPGLMPLERTYGFMQPVSLVPGLVKLKKSYLFHIYPDYITALGVRRAYYLRAYDPVGLQFVQWEWDDYPLNPPEFAGAPITTYPQYQCTAAQLIGARVIGVVIK